MKFYLYLVQKKLFRIQFTEISNAKEHCANITRSIKVEITIGFGLCSIFDGTRRFTKASGTASNLDRNIPSVRI
jgi:hypothetical protein